MKKRIFREENDMLGYVMFLFGHYMVVSSNAYINLDSEKPEIKSNPMMHAHRQLYFSFAV